MEKYQNPDASIKYTDSLEGILNAAENAGRTVIKLLPPPVSIYGPSSRGGGDRRPASNNSHTKGGYGIKRQRKGEHTLSCNTLENINNNITNDNIELCCMDMDDNFNNGLETL